MEMFLGQFLALLTAACWAQNSIIYSYIGKRVSSQTVAHIRLWIALPLILAVHLLFTGVLYPTGLSLQTYIYLYSSGLVGFFIADLLIFYAFVDLGPRETLVIMTSSPIFSALLTWIFLGEALTLMQFGGVVVTISGVMWVIYEDRRSSTSPKKHYARGVLIAFGGSLTQAIGMVLAKGGMADQVHPVSANTLRITAGLIGLVIYALMRKQFIRDFVKLKNIRLALLLASAAFVGPVLGIILTLAAFSLVPVGVATALSQLSPVLLLPVERFFLKKRIRPGAVLGTLTAISGAVILFLF